MSQEDQDRGAFEREAERRQNAIIYVTNISSEDFEHSFGGQPYSIKAKEKLPFIRKVGEHLAKHLARKIARDEARKSGLLKETRDRASVNIFAPARIQAIVDKILGEVIEQPLLAVKTEEQIAKEKTQKLQDDYRQSHPPVTTKVSKKDVVDELKKHGIKFDPRKETVEELLKKLTDSELEPPVDEEDEEK